MPYQTGIPAAIARFGVTVETIPGWETRGSSNFAPKVVIDHWTAGPRGATGRPSLRVVRDGHGSLPGPLAQVYLARDGVAVVVAAGRANHAGIGGYRGVSGNSNALGIEAEAAGNNDWTVALREAYPRVVAGLLSMIGRDASWTCGHNEWAPSRKIDIQDWGMSLMRSQVAALLSGGAMPAASPATVPGPAAPTGKPLLRQGTRSAHVGVVQRFLGITDDNIFGPATRNAVISYQRAVGLTPDGYVGKDTWAKIDAGVRPTPPPASSIDITGLQRLLGAVPDNIWGHDTQQRFHAVRAASRFHGGTFPLGVKYLQTILGVSADGIWGKQSSAAHDRKVAELQSAMGIPADGIWGPQTEAAYQAALHAARS